MVYVRKRHMEEMIDHALQGWPLEVCGILAGRGGCIEQVFRTRNKEARQDSFLMEPVEQLRLMKEMRKKNLEMLGIYHSHPETEAYPSAKDISMAFYEDALYFIVSLKDRARPYIRVFRIKEGRVEEEELRVIGD